MRPRPDAPAVTRNYSLCGPPGIPNYRIAVKNERGLASGFLHQSVGAGSHLEVSAPRGSFTLAAGATPIVLISAGVGVTPMLAMLHGAAATNAEAPRPIWWLHSARDRAHHSFAKEADNLLVALRASHRCVTYSRPAPGDMLGQDFDAPGHLSLELLHELGVPQGADFYLCGPPAFLEDFQKGLAAWGIPWPRVHIEVFGPPPTLTPGISSVAAASPHRPDGPAGGGPVVTFLRSGLTVPWELPLQQPARTGGSLRRSRALVLPIGRMPQLRKRLDRRRTRLRARAVGSSGRRQRAHLLLNAQDRRRDRPLIGLGAKYLRMAGGLGAFVSYVLTERGVENDCLRRDHHWEPARAGPPLARRMQWQGQACGSPSSSAVASAAPASTRAAHRPKPWSPVHMPRMWPAAVLSMASAPVTSKSI